MKNHQQAITIIFQVLIALLSFPTVTHAHKASDSYLRLTLQQNTIVGTWEIAVKDLDNAVGLDLNEDLRISWGELRGQSEVAARYAQSHLTLKRANQACATELRLLGIERHSDGAYAAFELSGICEQSEQDLDIEYSLLFELDPTHRGLVTVTSDAGSRALVFSPSMRIQAGSPASLTVRSLAGDLLQFVKSGIWHIWEGFDHLLFLCTLLLPAVVFWREGRLIPVGPFKRALLDVVKVVTSFTLAHSITLSLVTLGVLQLPSRLVESLIAFSVAVSALNNLWPIIRVQSWKIALVFGLIHGFGFASVLAEAGLPQRNLVGALLGFNLGVELGQLVVVGLLFPVLFLVRGTTIYRHVGFRLASLTALLISLVWMTERIWNVSVF